MTQHSPLAGKPVPADKLVDLSALNAAYFAKVPDLSDPGQQVAFGTSGHRGSSLNSSFNEWHMLAITQATCDYRRQQGIDGPLFLGRDTHALSEPAFASVLEVLAANDVEVMIAGAEQFTPTPVISHAILGYNRGLSSGLADGIVVTPSHNPPESGGIKYNPCHGGPAESGVTRWIEVRANKLLHEGLKSVRRMPYEQALHSATTHHYDYLNSYVDDLDKVIDMQVIHDAGLKLGVDPMGGAGLSYWQRIAEHYQLDLNITNQQIDPQFGFMTLDWDGSIRMDPSSAFAMQALVELKDQFDVAFACDPDHDRHGIVTPTHGLLSPNYYLAVCIDYLFSHRPEWPSTAAVGKTVVSSRMIDRVATWRGRALHEMPVGFKWFAGGLLDSSFGFAGEESAGATFLRRDASVWTTDKDGVIAGLLAAEITARTGLNPGERYDQLTTEFGSPSFVRVEAPATRAQKKKLSSLMPEQIRAKTLAGEKITAIDSRAPGNNAPIGGIRVSADNGWFAARPSGTEELYKIYAESFLGEDHLQQIVSEAEAVVNESLA